MNEIETYAAKAGLNFEMGYNCAQSVFGSLAELSGMDAQLAFKLAAPFGLGASYSVSLCGALTGGLLALGSVFGNSGPDSELKLHNYAMGSQLVERFRTQFGNVECAKLQGMEIRSEADLAEAREKCVFKDKCSFYVTQATRMACEIMLTHKKEL